MVYKPVCPVVNKNITGHVKKREMQSILGKKSIEEAAFEPTQMLHLKKTSKSAIIQVGFKEFKETMLRN